MNQHKKSRTVRLRIEYYKHIKDIRVINRGIYWMCDVISIIKRMIQIIIYKLQNKLMSKKRVGTRNEANR